MAIHRTHPSPDLSAAIGILGRFLGDAPAAQDARWLAMGEPSRSGAVAALHEPAA